MIHFRQSLFARFALFMFLGGSILVGTSVLTIENASAPIRMTEDPPPPPPPPSLTTKTSADPQDKQQKALDKAQAGGDKAAVGRKEKGL